METARLFAVIRTRGPDWQSSLDLEQQPGWREHAVFMNGLLRDGHIVLGGPLEGTPDVLLIMRASSPEEIASLLNPDPWAATDQLRISKIMPWNLRLGTLPA